jgi:hypothetical protein
MPMTTDLRRTLFERLIDDAGLFPPARLPMADALAAHAANRVGPLSWMQGRFVAPASQLSEITAAWPEGLAALRLALVADGAAGTDGDGFADALAADLAAAAALERDEGRVRVELVEVRVPDPAAVELIAPAVRQAAFAGTVATFAEAHDSTDPDALRATVAAVVARRAGGTTRLGAKIRTGGLEPSMFPGSAAVAAFLDACVAEGVPFKATAGLHHPLRGDDPTSGLRMHGFVNLLVATALLQAGALDEGGVRAVLDEEDATTFRVAAGELGWADHEVDPTAVASVRAGALASYGSCSFDEPTTDLAALGWLP